ncbi:uncharacterized protein LOC107627395 [Arachis ipaensis]|uniref:uncharacterized protein LOC107627395 n=1 Tax=Arachis ipaensis TaxID=130454 RepID=UPI000A2B35A6|nr:uncharacterized protein LOC107627395 [Arachis ipaensis]
MGEKDKEGSNVGLPAAMPTPATMASRLLGGGGAEGRNGAEQRGRLRYRERRGVRKRESKEEEGLARAAMTAVCVGVLAGGHWLWRGVSSERGKVDTTLFIMIENKNILLVQVYIDDIIFGSTNESLCKFFSNLMQSEFEMSMMGELNFFLGLQIKQGKEGTFVSQTKYCKELLKRFGMDNAKAMDTPMSTTCYLDKDEQGKNIDVKKYRGMIGSLLYLTASRPDIMFSVCMCARYQANPKESHLSTVKRIMKYLIGTLNVGLWYPKGSTCDLIGYSDSDFAGCKLDRKSTSGTCHLLGNSLVSWRSKKQVSVALSTAEAEYVAAGSCCAQILWMKQQLVDYGLMLDHIPIKCDNTSVINLTKNPVQHSRTKHIEIRHHFIRDHVQKGDVVIELSKLVNN